MSDSVAEDAADEASGGASEDAVLASAGDAPMRSCLVTGGSGFVREVCIDLPVERALRRPLGAL